MSADLLAGIASTIISLAFSYIPKADGWWETLDETYRRLIMLGVLVLVALGAVGLACTGLAADFGLTVTCDKPGIIALVRVFGVAVIVNQSAFKITPRTKAKFEANLKRDLVKENS